MFSRTDKNIETLSSGKDAQIANVFVRMRATPLPAPTSSCLIVQSVNS